MFGHSSESKPATDPESGSVGSCQFPTLGFVVDQFLKAESFVPEAFWKIDVAITKEDITANFTWQRGHLFDKLFCFVLYEACCESPTATVIKATSKPTSKWYFPHVTIAQLVIMSQKVYRQDLMLCRPLRRPLPMTTVELQKMGTRILRLSGDRIMQVVHQHRASKTLVSRHAANSTVSRSRRLCTTRDLSAIPGRKQMSSI